MTARRHERHVIEGASTVYVQLHAGDPIPARVVGAAPEYDIAVVIDVGA